MRKVLLTMVVLFVAHVGMAQDAAFKADVIKYIELSGQRKTFEMITKDIINNIPVEKQADFKKELDLSINDLISKIADAYVAEFTHEDIKAAIKFYETPAGKKLASKTEVLFQKSQAAGQEWGMGLQELMMKYAQ